MNRFFTYSDKKILNKYQIVFFIQQHKLKSPKISIERHMLCLCLQNIIYFKLKPFGISVDSPLSLRNRIYQFEYNIFKLISVIILKISFLINKLFI